MDIFIVNVQVGNVIRPVSVTAISETVAKAIINMRMPFAQIISIRSINQELRQNVIVVDFKNKTRVL